MSISFLPSSDLQARALTSSTGPSLDIKLELGMEPVKIEDTEEAKGKAVAVPVSSAFKPDYTTYVPSGQDIAGQVVNPLYADGRWTLQAFHEIHFIKEEWIQVAAIHNQYDVRIQEERYLDIGSVVTTGSEKVDSVTASAGFEGWGFSMNVGATSERKTFQSKETSKREGYKRSFDVPPKTSSYAYQKHFTFRLVIFFLWRDTQQFGGKELVYAHNSNGDVVRLECVQEIACDEWYYAHEQLKSGTATVTLPPPPEKQPSRAVCQWFNMNGASQHAIRTKYPGAAK